MTNITREEGPSTNNLSRVGATLQDPFSSRLHFGWLFSLPWPKQRAQWLFEIMFRRVYADTVRGPVALIMDSGPSKANSA